MRQQACDHCGLLSTVTLNFIHPFNCDIRHYDGATGSLDRHRGLLLPRPACTSGLLLLLLPRTLQNRAELRCLVRLCRVLPRCTQQRRAQQWQQQLGWQQQLMCGSRHQRHATNSAPGCTAAATGCLRASGVRRRRATPALTWVSTSDCPSWFPDTFCAAVGAYAQRFVGAVSAVRCARRVLVTAGAYEMLNLGSPVSCASCASSCTLVTYKLAAAASRHRVCRGPQLHAASWHTACAVLSSSAPPLSCRLL